VGLAAARRRDLAAEVRAGQEATRQFTLPNLRLIVSIAKRHQTPGLSLLPPGTYQGTFRLLGMDGLAPTGRSFAAHARCPDRSRSPRCVRSTVCEASLAAGDYVIATYGHFGQVLV
jgi:hypothetical protein